MSTRREELTRQAARLFAQKGYHGTSIGDLADAIGVQKGSLYAHIASKEDLLFETMLDGARAFHGALDAIDERLPATEKIRRALLRAAARRDPRLLDARVESARAGGTDREPVREPGRRGAAARGRGGHPAGGDARHRAARPRRGARARGGARVRRARRLLGR